MEQEVTLEQWQEQLQADFRNGLLTEQEVRDEIAAMRRALGLPVAPERQAA